MGKQTADKKRALKACLRPRFERGGERVYDGGGAMERIEDVSG